MRIFSLRQAAVALCAAFVAVPAWAETFSVAVVPDTQNYSDATLPQPRGADTFAQQMQYLVDSRGEKNLVFVTFVGDIVQHGDGQFRQKIEGTADQFRTWDTRAEWDNANRAVSILSRSPIPFGMSPGNHDYDNYSWWAEPDGPGASRPLAGGRAWDYYFGPSSRHLAGKPWYGGAFNQGLNSYQFFTGGGMRFLHLSLEMQPTPAALDWAQGVIDANPGLPIIVTTHEWLVPVLAKTSPARSNGYEAYFAGTDHLPPDAVWDRFIRKNARIFLILSGHNWTPTVNGVSQGENLRIDRNDAGQPVYQVLQDYQGNTIGPDGKPGSANGGAGWLRFMEFDTDRRKIRFYTYSPLLHRYAGRNGEKTFGAPARYSEFELDFPPQLR
ncbi:metallophosphoesterase [Sandaracinobacter sp. RS1-74]|uniref:metallophosphoesterase n=1 Tax=Sandaracinobacteroides sayramensis TaxID=2913411 RepID=UPI001EDB4EDB|nr:metallophosphoesterase [Sandaracinobacteroides sayramensis]MCG2842573.1 metallophosphoesterase [Sandaracinobacteroides sayramensis]